MKKILFLGRFPPPMHGAAKMNELYFSVLENKFRVKKIKLNSSSTFGSLGRGGVLRLFSVLVSFVRLFFSLIFFRPNLVYFELAPTGLAFFRDSIFVLLCKLFRRKIVFSLHARGLNKNSERKINFIYSKRILRKTKVIILSELLYSDVDKFFKKEQIFVLPNGIINEVSTKEFLELKKRKKEKKKKILFLSNMLKSKGPLDALVFAKLLKNKKINFEMNFVGPFTNNSFEKRWYNQLNKFGLQEVCFYLGSKYGEDKKNILKETDFLIFPTKYPQECFPLVILEAFMFGIPALAYDNGAIREIISKDYLGFVSLKKDVTEFVKPLEKGYSAEKIRTHFLKNFEIEKSSKKLITILNSEANI